MRRINASEEGITRTIALVLQIGLPSMSDGI